MKPDFDAIYEKHKKEILHNIEVDMAIGADTYHNVGLLKLLEQIYKEYNDEKGNNCKKR